MSKAPVLYQETRVSPTPSSPAAVLHINAAGKSTSSISSVGRKRTFDDISGLDEDTYARKHLATEGSVFFRPKSKAPRSFLWRVLDDRQLLEIRCVDFSLEQKHAKSESWLTFRVAFPSQIIPNGVALADAVEKDALEAFVLTAEKELYTITLRRDLLVRETAPADFDASMCVKKATPSQFSYQAPYRLVANSSLELFVSLQYGGLLRLDREKSDSGENWRETFYGEGGWKETLKRSFPFAKPQTVQYGKLEVYSDAVAAMAKSPDGNHIWTVGLDHMLRAWNLETGKIVVHQDMLGENTDLEDRRKTGRYVMGPEQGTLLQIVTPSSTSGSRALTKSSDSGNYFVIVHSPREHQFKFFAVSSLFSSVEGETIQLQDVAPHVRLIPPIEDLLNTNIWHLENFTINHGPDVKNVQLWVKARSGAISRVFVLSFDLLREGELAQDIQEAFVNGWAGVDSSYLSSEQLKESHDFHRLQDNANEMSTPGERWIEFLFYPGRFSEMSLETALNIYMKGRNLPTTSAKGLRANEEPLKQRIVTAVSTKILLRRSRNEQPDYDQYQRDLQTQWEMFFSLLSHLHNRRSESVGYAFDLEEGLPWTVRADFVAPVRTSSRLEALYFNADLLMDSSFSKVDESVYSRIFVEDDDMPSSRLIAICRQLRGCFPVSSLSMMRNIAVTTALDHSAESSAEDVMQAIYKRCAFQDEISERDYDELSSAAEELEGLGNISDDNFLMVLELLEEMVELKGSASGERLADFGVSSTVAIAQESLQRVQSVLLDLLALVTFLHCDLEQDQLSPEFRPTEVYDAIMLRLRHTEFRLWLFSNVAIEGKTQDGRSSQPRTLYQWFALKDWTPKPDRKHVSHQMPELITTWSKAWTFGTALNTLWEAITSEVFAELLARQELDLAADSIKFLHYTAWTSYLQGRLRLMNGDYAAASFAFKEAAEEMSQARYQPQTQSRLLSPEELNYFGRGPAYYFQHVSALFEKLKAYSYTAEFASLALSSLDPDDHLTKSLRDIDRKKSMQDSPAGERVDTAMEEIHLLRVREAKDDLRNRLFNALVQTAHFEQAFHVLTQMVVPAVQKSNLHTLIRDCIKRDAVPALLGLPITGDLAQEADGILLKEAKKTMESGLPSGPQYHQILFAFRTQHNDFRGAAAILYEHLERLRTTNRRAVQDPEDERLVHAYVLLINTLACCGEDEAWLLADPLRGVHDLGAKRRLVTLEDIRREYVAELDRRSDLLQGRFPLYGGDGDEMDVF